MTEKRSSTPERLRMKPDSVVDRILGRGMNGEVKTIKDSNGKEVAIKTPLDSSKNIKQEYEFIFKKSITSFIEENHYMENINVVPALEFTKSKRMFASEENPESSVFTMPIMDGTLASLSGGSKKVKRLLVDKAINVLSEAGFIMADMKDENIYLKNDKVCIGDCGECRIKSGSNAEEIFNATSKQYSFDPEKFSDFIEPDYGRFFS